MWFALKGFKYQDEFWQDDSEVIVLIGGATWCTVIYSDHPDWIPGLSYVLFASMWSSVEILPEWKKKLWLILDAL